MSGFFDTKIEFLKGVGPQRADLLNKELSIFSYGDLLQHYPFRYEDRSKFYKIRELHEELENVQVIARILKVELIGMGGKRRLVAHVADETGEMEMTWFKGIQWVQKKLPTGAVFIFFGKPAQFGRKWSIAHPEMEPLSQASEKRNNFQPVYSTTEKLRARFLDSRGISKIMEQLVQACYPHIQETLPQEILQQYQLIGKREAVKEIHFPSEPGLLHRARKRLKFEEFFFLQLRLLMMKVARTEKFKGQVLDNTELLTDFYQNHIPFELTNAQKRVIREAYHDLKSGKQMNRLVQGDVGSGKTIVSLISAQNVILNGYQVAFMAPTEILAKQHYNLYKRVFGNNASVDFLTGKTDYKKKRDILNKLENKKIKIIFGTHALFQKKIKFKKLGLIVVDEQHKFGVNQRKKLSEKGGSNCDVLVMSATPIPRTMMMTLYGDMDITLIKSKPKNRKDIKTYTKDVNKINDVINYIKKEISNENQVFWVCPLIEASKKIDHQSSIERYKYLTSIFKNKVGLIHGSIKKDDKEKILNNFLNNKINILVSTTVIEVGIDFPNATCIVIENSNKFGLSQLHQLRGRVGRGFKQSTCILLFKSSLSENARKRLKILKSSNDGFHIAEEDLKLRGYGDLLGFQQSGQKTFRLADPILNEDLFILAEKELKKIEKDNKQLSKYNTLLKIYDRADIINELI